jgi:heme A synthase
MTTSFIIALIVDCIGVLIGLYFIISDALKQSSSNNSMLSLTLLAACAWIGIAYYLHTHGSSRIGTSMLWVPAIPLLGYGLIILLMVVGKPDFR